MKEMCEYHLELERKLACIEQNVIHIGEKLDAIKEDLEKSSPCSEIKMHRFILGGYFSILVTIITLFLMRK